MEELKRIFSQFKKEFQNPKKRKLILFLSGLMAIGTICLVVLVFLVLNLGNEENETAPIENTPSDEEISAQLQEEGLADWEKENLGNANVLEFGDVVIWPMEQIKTKGEGNMNLLGIYGEEMLFANQVDQSYAYNLEEDRYKNIIAFSFYHFLSKDGSQAFYERSDSFGSNLTRLDFETGEEEMMMTYEPTEIVIDVIDIDNEKGLVIIRNTIDGKITVRSFNGLGVADTVGLEFMAYVQELPNRSSFYRDGEKIGIISNKSRMEWNGKNFTEVEKWEDDRFFVNYVKDGKNTAAVYFDPEDNGHLVVNGEKVNIEGTPSKAVFLSDRVVGIVAVEGLFFYDIESKEFHRMNDAYDIYKKGNHLFIETMNLTDEGQNLFKIRFEQK